MKEKFSDSTIDINLKKINFYYFIPPIVLLLLTLICLFITCSENSFACSYPKLQKELFININSFLNNFSTFENNITYLGDAFVLFPFFSYLFYKGTKVWQSLITASILGLILTKVFKKIIAMPRPAVAYEENCFHIIGKKLVGLSSLPSGHSITIFFALTILFYALFPKKNISKIIWTLALIIIGILVITSRIAVGAHYPIDVFTGSIIGYIIGISGIIINNKLNWLSWLNKPIVKPIFIVLFLIWLIVLIIKFYQQQLIIYLFSILSLTFTLYLMIKHYVKTKN